MHTENNFESLRDGVRSVVSQFDSRYWQEIDEARAFPEAFVTALTEAGWLSGLIPEAYGGSGLSLTEASVVMEEINRAGGNSGACHGQMYVMGCVVRHGSEQQKRDLLPRIARGELRMQSMASLSLLISCRWLRHSSDLARSVSASTRNSGKRCAQSLRSIGMLISTTSCLMRECRVWRRS